MSQVNPKLLGPYLSEDMHSVRDELIKAGVEAIQEEFDELCLGDATLLVSEITEAMIIRASELQSSDNK